MTSQSSSLEIESQFQSFPLFFTLITLPQITNFMAIIFSNSYNMFLCTSTEGEKTKTDDHLVMSRLNNSMTIEVGEIFFFIIQPKKYEKLLEKCILA
ncbi:hypothetical protein EPI10_000875 [Gossypium australe]|uniref:Transmembrane protein n=1 Tax=Gossypium australe TaxID=47621 RepID=A0A5B6V9H9_9ROSI|nr:hypothetical protein EPI10_000875 [Gossypium australe]